MSNEKLEKLQKDLFRIKDRIKEEKAILRKKKLEADKRKYIKICKSIEKGIGQEISEDDIDVLIDALKTKYRLTIY